MSSPALGQALALKMDATIQTISRYLLPTFTARMRREVELVMGRRKLSTLFPNRVKANMEVSE